MWVKPGNQHQKSGHNSNDQMHNYQNQVCNMDFGHLYINNKIKKQNKIEHDKFSNMEGI